jgi:tRNA nucleotidyltransferase (CCA-adding enzyme)
MISLIFAQGCEFKLLPKITKLAYRILMHAFESHRQWNAVKEVYSKLRAKGFTALLAGGCVRDLIMGRTPNDFDIATNATPDQASELFPNALMVGKEFGVTIIPYDRFHVEVATFRVDGSYKDGRRPESVKFSTPEEDSRRRDFTVNALFYDLENKKVIDYVGGEADIKAKIIRAVGEPEKRFEEDKLRLLRAVRFAAQLDFEIAPETFTAVKKLHSTVTIVAAERIRDELVKLVKTPSADRGYELLLQSGLGDSIFPELKAAWEFPSSRSKTISHLRGGAASAEIGFLNLFYEASTVVGVDVIRDLLKRLKASNQEIDTVIWALKNKTLIIDSSSIREALLIRALATPYAETAEAFFDSDVGAMGVDRATHEKSKVLREKLKSTALQNTRELPERFITGDDLQKLGVPKGPKLGEFLEEAFNLQLESKLKSRDETLSWVISKKSEYR